MAKIRQDLVVDLRADIANFQVGMSKAQQEIQRTAASLKREMAQNSREAQHSLELLGDTIGVHLPRQLRNMVGELPTLARGLSAAFEISGVIAFGAIIADSLIPKIIEATDAMVG